MAAVGRSSGEGSKTGRPGDGGKVSGSGLISTSMVLGCPMVPCGILVGTAGMSGMTCDSDGAE